MEIGKPGRASDVVDLRGKTPAQQAVLNPVGPAAPPPSVGDPWGMGPGANTAPTSPMVPGSVSSAQMGTTQPAPRTARRVDEEETSVGGEVIPAFQMGNANFNEFNGASYKVRPTTRTFGDTTQGFVGGI